MSTTTIRLPEDLKARIKKLAAAQGASVHGFMVDALSRAADQQERRLAFEAEAERRWKKLLKTGAYLATDDLHAYAGALARGEPLSPPKPGRMTADELAALRASARSLGDA